MELNKTKDPHSDKESHTNEKMVELKNWFEKWMGKWCSLQNPLEFLGYFFILQSRLASLTNSDGP